MRGLKISIIVLLTILLVGGGTFAYLFLKTDLFLTNKQAFYKYLLQEENVINNFSRYTELQQVNEEAYSSDAEIEISVEAEDEELTTGANINTVNSKDNIFSQISLNYQDKEFLKFNYLKEEDKHGLKFPGVKQYIVFENNNLKDFSKKLGLSDEEVLEYIPNRISDIYPNELVKVTDNEKEQIKNLVINAITYNVSEDRYLKEKAVNITVNNKNIETTSYSIELNEKDMLNISKSILEGIKENEILLQLIENKIDYILYAEEVDIFTYIFRTSFLSSMELLKKVQQVNNSLSTTNENEENDFKLEITREKILELLEESINELKEEIDNYNEKETAKTKISIYQNAGKTVKIKVELSAEQESYNSFNSDKDEETSIISNVIEIDNIENRADKSHILVVVQSYIDEELQEGQTTQIIIENGEGQSILKEQIQDLKDEKTLTTSEIKVSRVGKTIKTEGNIVTDQENSSVKLICTNTITIGNNNIEETLENNEVVLNELSLKQIEKLSNKLSETIEKEIKNAIPEFSFNNINSTQIALEAIEESEQSVSEIAIQAFNSRFEPYKGSDISGSKVKSLKMAVEANNLSQEEDRQVDLEGAENLDSSKTYSVEILDTNNDRYIDKIVVKED